MCIYVRVCVCGRWAVDRDLGVGVDGGDMMRGRERRCTVASVTGNY